MTTISEVFPIVVFFFMKNPIVGHDDRFLATIMGHDLSWFFLVGPVTVFRILSSVV